ncbi:uncharacterized protein J7T54_002713 [Emericellopsis cladophorae]|uniref:Rhodopsin domain-containing protein n=1 Tax=Emericellopsis cladophorae TaxID=2686198 RepID=A0A9P9XV32_9HYPO|nr:uncharacterized protein J7T54_002713 [Emericellopsis cladophorae]KAI6778178.1 hypothetical protein J7T54_002713 [Emericellopsis cladophorae]
MNYGFSLCPSLLDLGGDGHSADFIVAAPEFSAGMRTTQNVTLVSCGVPVRDRSSNLTTISAALFALTVIFVLVRFAFKVFAKLNFGMDDWLLLLTFITTIPSSVLFIVGLRPNGLGKDVWTLTAAQITGFLKYWYILAIVYFLQTTLVKITFVTFYMRIFTTRNTRRILWCTFAIVSLWGIAFVILAMQVCTPISYMWTQWDGEHKGKCVNDAAYVWTNAATNIALDVWILAVPLWELRHLQLHWKKKIGVALMFSLGAFQDLAYPVRVNHEAERSLVPDR